MVSLLFSVKLKNTQLISLQDLENQQQEHFWKYSKLQKEASFFLLKNLGFLFPF